MHMLMRRCHESFGRIQKSEACDSRHTFLCVRNADAIVDMSSSRVCSTSTMTPMRLYSKTLKPSGISSVCSCTKLSLQGFLSSAWEWLAVGCYPEYIVGFPCGVAVHTAQTHTAQSVKQAPLSLCTSWRMRASDAYPQCSLVACQR